MLTIIRKYLSLIIVSAVIIIMLMYIVALKYQLYKAQSDYILFMQQNTIKLAETTEANYQQYMKLQAELNVVNSTYQHYNDILKETDETIINNLISGTQWVYYESFNPCACQTKSVICQARELGNEETIKLNPSVGQRVYRIRSQIKDDSTQIAYLQDYIIYLMKVIDEYNN